MNFLLIDDQRNVVRPLRGVLESHFRREGIRLFHCATIPDGLKEAKSESGIVLVLLDLGMPCVKGGPIEAVEYVRRFPQPVVCYTAHDDSELRQRASELGAAGFICKNEPYESQLAQLDEIVKQIKSARIRSKTEANDGLLLRKRPSNGFMATAVALTVLLGFIGGVIASAYTIGGAKQGIVDDIATAKADIATAKNESIQVKKDVEKVKTDHEAEHKEDQKIMHRMDIGLKLVMAKLGITPPRDGE